MWKEWKRGNFLLEGLGMIDKAVGLIAASFHMYWVCYCWKRVRNCCECQWQFFDDDFFETEIWGGEYLSKLLNLESQLCLAYSASEQSIYIMLQCPLRWWRPAVPLKQLIDISFGCQEESHQNYKAYRKGPKNERMKRWYPKDGNRQHQILCEKRERDQLTVLHYPPKCNVVAKSKVA